MTATRMEEEEEEGQGEGEEEEEGGGGEAVSRTVEEKKTVKAAALGHCWFLTDGDGTKTQQ